MDVDVIVVGSGNAGFCAAHSAAEGGASVLVLEKAPAEWAGGNSYFTQGSFRITTGGIDDIAPLLHDRSESRLSVTDIPAYSPADFVADMRRATQGRCDPRLTSILAEESLDVVRWLRGKGQRWELSYERRAFEVDGRWRFFGGGAIRTVGQGKALIARHTAAARETGVRIRYATPLVGLVTDASGAVIGVRVQGSDGDEVIGARAVVLGCGGFGANPQWRAAYLGQNWDIASVRGTPFNTGDGLAAAIAVGAQPHGHWSGCHSVSWDAEAPVDRGDRELTNALTRSSYMLGLVVNNRAQRFLDEGADIRTMTYAKYGAEVLRQPDAIAFHLFDSRTRRLLNPEYDFTAGAGPSLCQADTVDGLADALGLDPARLTATVDAYNAATSPGTFDPSRLDGLGTTGLEPPKSNWALPLDAPPFYGCRVTCGMTFTYGGLRVTPDAEVVGRSGAPIPGLYAAGEMVGGLFYHNYPGGAGLTSGAVFGRRAGRAAAKHAS